MRRMRRGLMAIGTAAVLLGMSAASAHAQKRDRDVITREEIDNSAQKEQDIHAVIRSLRPHFLAPPRGMRTLGNSMSKLGVYVDGVHETDFNALKNIPASSVLEVRYLDPSRSEGEYGADASGGAVVVKRIREPSPAAPPRDTTKPPNR